MSKKEQMIQRAVAAELAQFARVSENIAQAVEDGRISERDGEERTARAEQWTTNRIAFIKGEKRPRQRVNQPLDDPDAHKVG